MDLEKNSILTVITKQSSQRRRFSCKAKSVSTEDRRGDSQERTRKDRKDQDFQVCPSTSARWTIVSSRPPSVVRRWGRLSAPEQRRRIECFRLRGRPRNGPVFRKHTRCRGLGYVRKRCTCRGDNLKRQTIMNVSWYEARGVVESGLPAGTLHMGMAQTPVIALQMPASPLGIGGGAHAHIQ
jgi:hypothetical protein